ncbi:uncharacterized protein LOC123313968 [Coccinella septempunctata]|uniref:uncharacterized protein LOC123313968 n=1 Tax=Coccinella septempunctata TaxID=41139 RepID=UPI001D06ED69|nr:uncharacterized protein LOC123313968 [Coccinella septempunctata]
MGIPISDGNTLYTLHFADDQVIFAQDKDDIEFMTRKLMEEYHKWGLTVNMSKTQYMCVGGENEDLMLEGGLKIKSCEDYVYFGTVISQNGRTDKEIQQRINKGRKIIGALNSILWSKEISKQHKRDIYNVTLRSVVLYGCEAWQLSVLQQNRLLALEMDFWRRSAGVSRIQRIRNERIREIMDAETTIIDDIKKAQLTWYGHVQRMQDERIPKQILNWIPPERLKRGRPKTTWIQGIQKAMSERNLAPGDWLDRGRWKLGTGRRLTL